MATETRKETTKPLLIITCPRTASNLLIQMLSLNDQPHVASDPRGGYFFLPAMLHLRDKRLLDRPPEQWTQEETSSAREKFQDCLDTLHEFFESAEREGKKAVFKEHAPFMISPMVQADFAHGQQRLGQTSPWKVHIPDSEKASPPLDLPLNETAFPDEILLRCTPAFLIRHPALAFPSYHRLMVSFANGDKEKVDNMTHDMAVKTTLRWTRGLYDWYTASWQKLGLEENSPIILDADDILTDPNLVLHFCDLVGLDSAKVKFQWDSGDTSGRCMYVVSRNTLLASKGIIQDKVFQGLSIEGEAAKWKVEFGEKVASQLEKWVRDTMPDYLYLKERRLTLPSIQAQNNV